MGVSRETIAALFDRPLLDLLFEAQTVHRANHAANQVQRSTLLSIKTGGCPEDCGYCSQSALWDNKKQRQSLLDVDSVIAAAKEAKAGGSTRFCMGAAWRKVAERDMPAVERMIREVKSLGMETCVTLGTVSEDQAVRFRDAGLDYYNHNLDTSREHYAKVITTRTYDERLQTLANVRTAGVKVCCGGILGLGETGADRVGLLWELANMPVPPESVPINALVPIPGTPLSGVEAVDWVDFVKTIAVARITLPKAVVRLSAGREGMSPELQAMCFLAGANSIFAGEKLLTTSNPSFDADKALFERLGLTAAPAELSEPACEVPHVHNEPVHAEIAHFQA